MPEGPEVRRAADRIEAAVAAVPLARVQLWSPSLDDAAERLREAGLVRVETKGKASVLRFGDGTGVFVHLQLYGRWRIGRSAPKTNRSLRIEIASESRKAVRLYSATWLALLEAGEVHPFVTTLGLDPLDPATGPDAVDAVLEQFRRRRLADLLLDQHAFAGIGNYLRAEILWEAAISPDRRVIDLDPEARGRLRDAILALPRRALRTGGITVSPELAAARKADGLPRGRWHHHAYGATGTACPRCETTIVRVERGGRGMYACPGCQL